MNPDFDFDPLEVIRSFYPDDTPLRQTLLLHSRQVCAKALALLDSAPADFVADRNIAARGAMLHDIGIGSCYAPDIFCTGRENYIAHGIIGGRMLRSWGLEHGVDMEVFARICERHTGSGITTGDIISQSLPLPLQDYLPETPEEELICLADKFFSKSGSMQEKSMSDILRGLSRFGGEAVARLNILAGKIIR